MEHQVSHRIARHIQSLLDSQEISTREAARATGIPHSTLNRRLKGAASFNIHELDLLATLLGVNVAALFTQARDAGMTDHLQGEQMEHHGKAS